MSRLLVTSALPYANGPIHFGHVAGAYLPADVYVRHARMRGEDVLFVCGTDEHGVAITINAEKAGQDYGEYVARWRAEIHGTFTRLGIEFDVWSGTSVCPQHVQTSQDFFRRLDAGGYLLKRAQEQLYCPHDAMFLADRYVVGTCYACGHERARGDECPSCGTWIDPLRLTQPSCKVCGNAPERRSTTHWFLDLPKLRDEHMGRWLTEHEWKPNVAAFVHNLMKDVPERAITRDMSWGVPVPEDLAGGEQGKVLYVWFDAPIGYVSFTKQLMAERGTPDAWRDWWQSPDTRLVHFIGKDNIPFHCMVFPSMLYGTHDGYVLPWQVPANEFYNLAGGKFSTSEGRTLDMDAFFAQVDPESARCYILSTLPETADAEFDPAGLVTFHNASLAGNLGNLASRVLKFLHKNGGNVVPPLHARHAQELDALLLGGEAGEVHDPGEHLAAFRFRRALEALLANATVGNVFMQRTEPWKTRKEDPELAESALNTLCEWLRWCALWLTPFAPRKAQALWEQLGLPGRVEEQPWPGVPRAGDWRALAAGHPLGEPEALFPRLEALELPLS